MSVAKGLNVALFGLILLSASACQGVVIDDPNATLQADMIAYATEAASMQDDMLAAQSAAEATLIVEQTRAAEYLTYNQYLLVTVRAGETPQPQRRVVDVDPRVGGYIDPDEMDDRTDMNDMNAPAEGSSTRLVDITTAPAIREATDGCRTRVQTTFTPTSERIYATAIARDLRAGTDINVIWQHEGLAVLEQQWTADVNASSLCLWFYVEPSDINFDPGAWEVTFQVNGVAATPSASFRITPNDA